MIKITKKLQSDPSSKENMLLTTPVPSTPKAKPSTCSWTQVLVCKCIIFVSFYPNIHMGTSHKSDFIYMHTRDLAMPFFFLTGNNQKYQKKKVNPKRDERSQEAKEPGTKTSKHAQSPRT